MRNEIHREWLQKIHARHIIFLCVAETLNVQLRVTWILPFMSRHKRRVFIQLKFNR